LGQKNIPADAKTRTAAAASGHLLLLTLVLLLLVPGLALMSVPAWVPL
jgi:cytochrome b561